MCFLRSEGDDTPDIIADNAVYAALTELQLALVQQASVGIILAAGRVDADLDARITDADHAVFEATERFNVALCAQARGGPYRLLEASQGGVARSMRHRLAQSRRVAAIEADAARRLDTIRVA